MRRTHLVLGMLVFPWAIFFGASGVLFNHPNVGLPMERAWMPPEAFEAATGFTPVEAEGLARAVTASVSARTGLGLELDPEWAPELKGWALLQAAAPGGRHMVLMDLERGSAVVATRPRPPGPALAPFTDQTVRVAGAHPSEWVGPVEKMLEEAGKTLEGPVVTSPSRGPQLRFRVLDKEEQAYNVVWHLASGRVEARLSDSVPELGLAHLLGELHKTHHFTPKLESQTLWAAFADLTGLTLVLWGLTGLYMSWKMTKVRRMSLVLFGIGFALAIPITLSLVSDLKFGAVQAPGGPGPEPPRAVAQP